MSPLGRWCVACLTRETPQARHHAPTASTPRGGRAVVTRRVGTVVRLPARAADTRWCRPLSGRTTRSPASTRPSVGSAVVSPRRGVRPRRVENGAWEGNRTPDLRITNALLCRLSYPGARKQTTRSPHPPHRRERESIKSASSNPSSRLVESRSWASIRSSRAAIDVATRWLARASPSARAATIRSR